MITIAVIASADTKRAEMEYVRERLTKCGTDTLMIDISTSTPFTSLGDITREDIAAAAGHEWEDIADRERGFFPEVMARGATAILVQLHEQGRIHGVLGLGGLQNTTVAARAMQALPLGFPKVIVSTIACGTRTFDMVVGTKDVTVIPAITDLAGLNPISERVLANAVGAVVGMVQAGARAVERPGRATVGATLMGATNDGVVRAVGELERASVPVMCFHATGVGGQVLEDLIREGMLAATLDLTLHEVVYEHFGAGFGAGTHERLSAGAETGIPMVVAPGGLDFICQWRSELFADAAERKMVWHNAQLAHVRLREHEARAITALVVERINRATGPVTVLFPTQGLRTLTRAGEPLHDPHIDAAILDELERGLRREIPVKRIDANLVDAEFSHAAATEMLELLNVRRAQRR